MSRSHATGHQARTTEHASHSHNAGERAHGTTGDACAICGSPAAGIDAPTGVAVCTACARAGIDPGDVPASASAYEQARPAARYRVRCPACGWTSPVRHVAQVIASAQRRLHDRETHDAQRTATVDRLHGHNHGHGHGRDHDHAPTTGGDPR